MKYLFPEAKTFELARTQSNIIESACNLEADGYLLMRRSRPTLFGVYKPGNTRPARGVWHSDYSVDLTPGWERCTCKAFKKYGDCKHRISCALRNEEDAEYDRRAEEYLRNKEADLYL